jgi:cytochrome c oxidase subunit 2
LCKIYLSTTKIKCQIEIILRPIHYYINNTQKTKRMKIKLSGKLKNLIFLSAAFLIVNLAGAAVIKESISGKPVDDATIAAGKGLFENKCKTCHAIDNKQIGPALKDVHKRRSYDWLTKWIRNNESLRKSGDKDAIDVWEKNNKAIMNAFPDLKDEEIASLVMYIEDASAGGDKPVAAAGSTAPVATEPVDEKAAGRVNWAIILLFILISAILFMIVKIIEQVSVIRGKEVINWNKVNGWLMLGFMIVGFIACFWEFSVHGKLTLPEAATEHGRRLDQMFDITLYFTGFVFVVTQFLLFYFGFKYRGRKGNVALHLSHNNKLEAIWTLIPAVVLTILVIGGLKTWNSITNNPERDKFNVEIFAYQFGWTARFPGDDGKLGKSNWNLISDDNLLGVAIKEKAESMIPVLEKDIVDFQKEIKNLPVKLGELKSALGGLVGAERKLQLARIAEVEDGTALEELEKKISNRTIQIGRIKASLENKTATDFYDNTGLDDIIVNDEIHIPVNKTVTFKCRARDVIHSAYIPMFRSQINVVPGLPTEMVFKAIETTKEKQEKLNRPDFDYYILCAKICGAGHYSMKMKIIVDSEKDYKAWISKQTGAFVKEKPAETPIENQKDTTSKKLAIN